MDHPSKEGNGDRNAVWGKIPLPRRGGFRRSRKTGWLRQFLVRTLYYMMTPGGVTPYSVLNNSSAAVIIRAASSAAQAGPPWLRRSLTQRSRLMAS